jgi:hypothetical protein
MKPVIAIIYMFSKISLNYGYNGFMCNLSDWEIKRKI